MRTTTNASRPRLPLHFALGTLLASAALLSSPADAATFTFNLSPSDISSTGILNAASTGGESIPIGVLGSPAGWETGSFLSDIDGVTKKYSQLYVNLPLALGVTSLNLDDLASITYYTKQGTPNSLDWALRIYTKPVAGVTSFYQYRFDGINPTAAPDWTQWNADTDGWFHNVSDRSNGANVNVPLTGHGLSEIKQNYNGELLYFSMFTGASTNTQELNNGLDGLVVTMTNGDEVRINMVPEPGTASLLAVGATFLLRHTRRRERAVE